MTPLDPEILKLINRHIVDVIDKEAIRTQEERSSVASKFGGLGRFSSGQACRSLTALYVESTERMGQSICQEIDRIVSATGVSYSPELTDELKAIVARYIRNDDEARDADLRLVTSFGDAQKLQKIFPPALRDARSRTLRSANNNIDLLVTSLKAGAQRGSAKEREVEQKFGILLSPALEDTDFEEWRSTCSMIGLLFIDIDNFKQLNQSHTETKIDATVLPEFQNLLKSITHYRGEAYRHGGDEFIIILPNHDREETGAFAEKVRAGIKSNQFSIDEKTITVTVSIGVALFPDNGGGLGEVLAAANRAEHVAKRKGGNKIEVASNLNGQEEG